MKPIIALFLVALATSGHAQSSQRSGGLDIRTENLVGIDKVPERGGTARISKHGFCRIIRNNTVMPVLIPSRTPAEWSVGTAAFLNNLPVGVTATNCP